MRASLLLLIHIAVQVRCAYSGLLTLDNTMIQASNVQYSFTLNFQKTVPAGGRLVIRFPVDYQNNFQASCAFISGFTSTSGTCTYQTTTRMLTITNVFPTKLQQVKFTVSGVTNPQTATTTQQFQITSFDAANSILENGAGLTATPTTGSLTSASLSLSNPTVGLLSVLTIQFVPQHAIPYNGIITLTLPKWNQYDPNTQNLQSMISVATSPGDVECLPQLGLISLQTSCVFTKGSTTDSLQIHLAEASNVASGTLVSMLIQGVRAPPSQTIVTGFTLTTKDLIGTLIDEVKPSSSISLKATIPVRGSSQSASVSAIPVTINSISNVTLQVQNNNPLLTGATVQITVPADFNMNLGPIQVQCSGNLLDPSPIINVVPATRSIVIQRFNLAYLEGLSYSYFFIYGMGNPGQTATTASFVIYFLDQNMQQVEYIDNGVSLTATVNGFDQVSVKATNQFINTVNVGYVFDLLPHDSFNSSGIIKLQFPTQLVVAQGAVLSQVSTNMKQSATIVVQYEHVVTISKAFPNGYNKGDVLQFTLMGVTNPPTTEQTDSITVKIYYVETSSEINVYTGSNLTFKASPSQQIWMSISPTQMQTGQSQTNFTITGSTPASMVIAKGAVVLISIPGQFVISNPTRVAASCTALNGFSDEILCEFLSISSKQAVLKVMNGFDSKVFPGGDFSFQIQEILNPFNTKTTDTFSIQVLDANSQPLYVPSSNNVTAYVRPQDFAYSFVQSTSTVNGASSLYNFSVTFSVDTPVGAILAVTLPDEITFDTTKPFLCNGTIGFATKMQCTQRNNQSVWVTLLPNNTFINTFSNGTTLQFQLGYLLNPISLQTSKSFGLSTFTVGNMNAYYYINQKQTGLQITNLLRGSIDVVNITQIFRDLGSATQLHFGLITQSPIPQNSVLVLSLPTNLVQQGSVSVQINSFPATATYDSSTQILQATVPFEKQTNFTVFVSGFVNPSTGPYTYSNFNFEFQTSNGWPIDQTASQLDIVVNCSGTCNSCKDSLANCLSCGPTAQNAPTYLSKNTCVLQCPIGQFGSENFTCSNCADPCTACNYTQSLCTKCNSQGLLPFANAGSLACYSQCPSGTYADSSSMQCLPCNAPCYTCTSATKCLTCSSQNQYHVNDTCVDSCPNSTIASPSRNCVPCDSPCATCSQLPDKCTSCLDGLFLWKNLCVKDCPWQTYADKDECKSVASLKIPFPFTILIAVASIGVAISGCMKHGGRGSTQFFITCLALCDMLLRVNWLVVGLIALNANFQYTFYGCIALLGISIIINLFLWRRFFKYKYNMDENDQKFSTYCKENPHTSSWLLFLSYLISFQAVRLTYSKLLGKKQFMASFTRKRRYFRLISQLSMIEMFLLYLPAIGLMIYSLLFFFEPGDQLFYLGVDSLSLVTYAVVLIIVTVCQKEQSLGARELFNWSEVCRCCVDSDEEPMYTQEEDQLHYDDLGPYAHDLKQPKKVQKVMAAGVDSEEACKVSLGNCESAAGFREVKKKALYKTEQRFDDLRSQKEVDYSQVQQIEEKLNRIKIKAQLYENRRHKDYQQVQVLSSNLHGVLEEKDNCKKTILKLQNDLKQLQNQIDGETNNIRSDVDSVIQRKREDIKQRNESPRNLFHFANQRQDTDHKSGSGYMAEQTLSHGTQSKGSLNINRDSFGPSK